MFSGGKDSTYTFSIARRSESVDCLVTLIPEKEDSYMFHYPNIRWTSMQAQALATPQIIYYTKGEKETEVMDLLEAIKLAIKEYDVKKVYAGAIASNYQRERVIYVCKKLSLKCVTPLWGIDQREYMRILVKEKFRAIITSVSALGLDESFLGKEITKEVAEDIILRSEKYGFNPALEGGEGETFVIDCPTFIKKIRIIRGVKIWNGYSGTFLIKEARLEPKD